MYIILQFLSHAQEIRFYEINQNLVLLDALRITVSLLLSPSFKVFATNVHRVSLVSPHSLGLGNYKLLHLQCKNR